MIKTTYCSWMAATVRQGTSRCQGLCSQCRRGRRV